MAYKSYVNADYYLNRYEGDIIPEEELSKALKKASRHIDSLTYNRIVSQGFLNLTEYQQDIIKEVICEQADFEYVLHYIDENRSTSILHDNRIFLLGCREKE